MTLRFAESLLALLVFLLILGTQMPEPWIQSGGKLACAGGCLVFRAFRFVLLHGVACRCAPAGLVLWARGVVGAGLSVAY